MDQLKIANFIAACRIEGTLVHLPGTLIDRNFYEKHIKKHFDNLGGKWNGSLKCYEFPYDPTLRLHELTEGKKVKLSTQYQYFDTPVDLAGHMLMFAQEARLNWSVLDRATAKVLEPGAGRATLLKVAHVQGFSNLFYYELMPENREVIAREVKRLNIAATFLGEDFLDRKHTGFDLVFANPPFRNDRKHIREMFTVVRQSGIVLTLASEDVYDDEKFMQYLDDVSDRWEMRRLVWDPDDPIFSGTKTGCTILAARKRPALPPGTTGERNQLSLFV